MARPPLPPDALVLGIGVAISAAAYSTWTWTEWVRTGAITALAAERAGFALAATLLLTLVLRLARRLGDGDGPAD